MSKLFLYVDGKPIKCESTPKKLKVESLVVERSKEVTELIFESYQPSEWEKKHNHYTKNEK